MLTKLIFNTSLLYFYNNKNKLVIHKNSCHFCWRESRLFTHIICLLPATSLCNNWHPRVTWGCWSILWVPCSWLWSWPPRAPLSSHQRGPWRCGQSSECISSYIPLLAPARGPCPLPSSKSAPWATNCWWFWRMRQDKEKGWKRPPYFLLQIFQGEERADYMSKYDI